MGKKTQLFSVFQRDALSLKPSSSIPIYGTVRTSFCFHPYCCRSARDRYIFYVDLRKIRERSMHYFEFSWYFSGNSRNCVKQTRGIELKVDHVELRVTPIYIFTRNQTKYFCPPRLGKFYTARYYGSRHLLLTSLPERISRRSAGQTLHHILLRYELPTSAPSTRNLSKGIYLNNYS